MVESQGLVWKGINQNMHGTRILFTDPQTGSTLALPIEGTNPKVIASHVAESRKAFADAAASKAAREAEEMARKLAGEQLPLRLGPTQQAIPLEAAEEVRKVEPLSGGLTKVPWQGELSLKGVAKEYLETPEGQLKLAFPPGEAIKVAGAPEKAADLFGVRIGTAPSNPKAPIVAEPVIMAQDATKPAASNFHRALTLQLNKISHPETVLDLEKGGSTIYESLHEAYHHTTIDVNKLENILRGATAGFNANDQALLASVLRGKIDPATTSPRVQQAAVIIRKRILDAIARLPHWEVLGEPGKTASLMKQGRYLDDYLTIFFNKAGTPRDVILEYAKGMAAKQGVAYEALDAAGQSKLLDEAASLLDKIPQHVFFGPISKHRLTSAVPDMENAADIVSRYIRGSLKKYYLDQALRDVKAIEPTLSPALRLYTQGYVRAFRGVPGSAEVMSDASIRAMLDGLEGMRGGKIIAKVYRTLFGTTTREMANLAKMIQADAKMGANLFSPIQNISQTTINTYAKAGEMNFIRAIKLRFSPEGAKLLKRSGVFLDVAKYDVLPEELIGMKGKITGWLLYGFNKSETFNREIAYLAGYAKAQRALPSGNWKLWDRMGRQMVDDTQFIFSVVGRPAALQGPIGSTLGQFRLFTLNQLRFIKNLSPAEKARFTLAVALHGGTQGVPGLSTLVKTAAGINLIQYIKDQQLPELAENLIIGGVPRAAGINLSQDVGFNFAPSSPKELVPPALSLPMMALQHREAFLKGDPGAKEAMLRETIRNLPAGVQTERVRQALLAASRGGVKLGREGRFERTLAPSELFLEGALGAKTTSAAKYREAEEFMAEKTEKIAIAKKQFRAEITKALADKNVNRFNSALETAAKAGVLESTDLTTVGQPSLVRQFLSMPKQARVQILTQNPAFAKLIIKELESMGIFYGGE
jgi:hypothetical protein